MAAQPNYAGTPLAGAVTLTLGDNSRTAPANYQEIIPTAKVPNGGLIERLTVMPLATTVASVLRLFKYDTLAVEWHLCMEIAIPAQTIVASQTLVPQTFQAVTYPERFPLILPTGWALRASINDAQTGLKVHAEGGAC